VKIITSTATNVCHPVRSRRWPMAPSRSADVLRPLRLVDVLKRDALQFLLALAVLALSSFFFAFGHWPSRPQRRVFSASLPARNTNVHLRIPPAPKRKPLGWANAKTSPTFARWWVQRLLAVTYSRFSPKPRHRPALARRWPCYPGCYPCGNRGNFSKQNKRLRRKSGKCWSANTVNKW
jgi:hypothetical protein